MICIYIFGCIALFAICIIILCYIPVIIIFKPLSLRPIIDMGRTMLNVSGTIASSIIVDRSLKRDEEKANKTVQKAV